jgi:CDGSH-type Zn-finger protein
MVTIKVRATGSYLIEGDLSQVRLIDHEGNPIPIPPGRNNIALCRCGASANKPFCDSSHKRTGFMQPENQQPAAPPESHGV